MNDFLFFKCNCKSYPVTAAIFSSGVRENSMKLEAYKLRELGLPYKKSSYEKTSLKKSQS